MGKAERIVVGLVCAGCLLVPAAMLLNELLATEPQAPTEATIYYTNVKPDLTVKFRKSHNGLPVRAVAQGPAVIETSADQIPTTSLEGAPAHTGAHLIPVSERQDRGLRPEPPAQE